MLTIAEIEAGIAAHPDPMRRNGFRQALDAIHENFRGRIAVIGEHEATAYLALQGPLKTAGQGIDPPDALIAATAIANDWTLASWNMKHLSRTGARLLNPWDFDPDAC